jgi:hypothetical protein
MTPLKAIRKKCLDCCSNSYKEVERCPSSGCPLYPYRLGRNPALNGKRGSRPKGQMPPGLQKYKESILAEKSKTGVPGEGPRVP